MPITEPCNPSLPVTQGDILKDVRLYQTKESWADAGGDSDKLAQKICLLISRPCVVGHKSTVVVAAVEKYSDRVPKDVQSFQDIRDFLEDQRDAPDAPDVFYLGQLPNLDGRYCAKLDSLHTIQIPQEADAVGRFAAAKRIGRLNIEFARDLHLRIFRAFASLGFDDHSWLSTDDLRWLVTKGRSEESTAEATVRAAESAHALGVAQGFKSNNERQQLEKAVTDANQALEDHRTILRPYAAELARRDQAGVQTLPSS